MDFKCVRKVPHLLSGKGQLLSCCLQFHCFKAQALFSSASLLCTFSGILKWLHLQFVGWVWQPGSCEKCQVLPGFSTICPQFDVPAFSFQGMRCAFGHQIHVSLMSRCVKPVQSPAGVLCEKCWLVFSWISASKQQVTAQEAANGIGLVATSSTLVCKNSWAVQQEEMKEGDA